MVSTNRAVFYVFALCVVACPAVTGLFFASVKVTPSKATLIISSFFFLALLVFAIAHSARETRVANWLWPINLLAYAWVEIVAYADLYCQVGLHGPADVVAPSRSDCLYFSIATWTTLGYGDFYPTADARMLAASEAALGYVGMGLLITLFYNALTAGSR